MMSVEHVWLYILAMYISNVRYFKKILNKNVSYRIACEVFSTGSVSPFVNDFKLTYEGREMITFPVKSIDNLVSLVTPLSVLIFPNFVVMRLSAPVFIMGLPTSLKTFYSRITHSVAFLSYVQ